MSFDASPSAVGYLYQVKYALLLALDKLQSVDDLDYCEVSIEKLDDISFQNGNAIELLQAKHHSKPGNLTDKSSDLWKTLRIWACYLQDNPDLEDVDFVLITTQNASKKSIAGLLSESGKRDAGAIRKKLLEASKISASKGNQKSYEAFRSLSKDLQLKLIRSIVVIGQAKPIAELDNEILKRLRIGVAVKHQNAFLERLVGSWCARCIDILVSDEFSTISLGELQAILDNHRAEFSLSNLPADFTEAQPDSVDAESDARIFVEQLRLIGLPKSVIERAIIHYYRSGEQKSKWLRDQLILPGELKSYNASLCEKWSDFLAMAEIDEPDPISIGKKTYKECQLRGAEPIRRDFSDESIAKGTYHELSESLKIGWHPDYKMLINSANDEVA